MDERLKKVLARLQAQCVRREYCLRDIRPKVEKAVAAIEGIDAGQAAEEIVASLLEDRFVDEARYAAAFAREKSSLQGWGPDKIRYMLRAKGINSQTITAAFGEISPEAADKKMFSVLKAKYRTVADCPDARLKLLKYGLGRGYSYDSLKEAVDAVISEAAEEG